jgi:asparagine synthase (glutamine-hydrolysing)
MTVRPEKIDTRRYFDIDPTRRIRYRTDAEYAEHFESLLKEAVRCRLRNVDGVAAELSGGLDSSLVVGTVKTLGPPTPRFETFSIKFNDPQADERGFASDVAAKWGLRINWSDPFHAEFSHFISEIRRYLQPSARPNTAMDSLMHGAIRDRGYRVVLTGQGGDQWFGGSPDCFADLLWALRFGALYRLIREESASPTRVLAGQGLLGLLLRRAIWPSVPPRPKALINRLRGARLVYPFIDDELARRFDLETLRRSPGRQIPGLSFAQRTMYQVLNHGIVIHFAEIDERECALMGLEGRHPFYDRRIIEFAFAIPEEQRCRPGATKYIIRQTRHDLLPESVRHRRDKAEFSYLLSRALRNVTAALGGDAAFDSFEVARRGWIEPKRFRTFFEERMCDPDANKWPLWSVMELEMWSRECLTAP